MNRSFLLVAVIGMLLLLASPASAQTPPELQEDAPEVVFTPLIQAKAAELGHDPVRIYEYVHNEIEFEAYHGLMKGPEGAMLAGAGNHYDQSALLVSLLRAASVPARFVRGRMKITREEAVAWTGAENGTAAARFFRYTDPTDWRGNEALKTKTQPDHILRTQLWVEAEVSMARYRGVPGGADTEQKVWVPLDPSFKTSTWKGDPSFRDLMKTDPELQFNYLDLGEDGYYNKVHPESPVEFLEDQLRSYLADNHDPSASLKNPSDVIPHTAINHVSPGVLPNQLPYVVVGPWGPIRSASLAELHQAPLSPDSIETRGKPEYLYKRSLHVCTSGTSGCDQLPIADSAKLIEASDWSAAWEGKRILLTFPPTPTSLPFLQNGGYAEGECDDINGDPMVTRPQISMDGTPLPISGVTDIELCNEVVIVVLDELPRDLGFTESRSEHTEGVGGHYLAGFDSHAASPERVRQAREALFQARNTYDVIDDPLTELPFVDENGNGDKDGGIGDGGELFLAQHFEAQEALTGGVLHLANTWYYNKVRPAITRVYEMYHELHHRFPAAGLVSAGQEVSYVFETPFAIEPSNLLVDIKGFLTGSRDRETGSLPNLQPGEYFLPTFVLGAHEVSAAEHTVWEEISGFEAISTVKGFQVGVEGYDREVLVIKNNTEAGAATSSCSSNGCTEIDPYTYCEIRKIWGTSGPWKAPAWEGSCPTSSSSGGTNELRILRFSEINHSGWTGYVYAHLKAGSGGKSISMSIAPIDASGGYATDWHYLDTFASSYSPPTVISYQNFDSIFNTGNDYISQYSWAGDPVSVLNGNFYTITADIDIPGRGGMNLRLVRSYNSRLEYAGPMGYGWTHTYDQHLRIDPGTEGADEERVLWIGERGTETPWDDEAGGLVAPEWVYHDLVREAGGSYTLTTKEGWVYRFFEENVNDIARLDSITDRNGNRLTCSYDVGGELIRVTDDAGQELTFINDANGNLEAIEDFSGRRWEYTVDGNGDLVEFTDPVQVANELEVPGSGRSWVYAYFPELSQESLQHNLRRFEKPEDADEDGDGDYTMDFVYYGDDTVYKHTDALGQETRFLYNRFRMRTDVEHPDGAIETHFYDNFGNITRFEDRRGSVHKYEVDAELHLRTAEIDPFGFRTLYEYDDQGNLTQRTTPDDEVESWSYNEWSQRTSHTNRRSHQRVWTYDHRGNLLGEAAEIDGNLATLARHSNDSFGNRIETISESGPSGAPPNRSIFEYDVNGIGRVAGVNGLGHRTRFTLDDLSRPVRLETDRSVLRNGQSQLETVVVENSYNELGRIVRSVDPAGAIAETEYNANGLEVERRTLAPTPANPSPAPRLDLITQYDPLDRPIRWTNALGEATSAAYDPMGRVLQSTTALGHETRYEYDAAGNRVRFIDPTGAEFQWEYDAMGRVVRSIDPLGQTQTIHYDLMGRPVRAYGPTGILLAEVLEYDEVGNPVQVQDAEGRIALTTYDEFQRAIEVVAPVGTPEEGTTHFEYDLGGRLLSRTDAEGRTTTVRYDVLGRVLESTDPLGRKSYASYDELGNLVASVNAAGEHRSTEYDARGLPTRAQGLGFDRSFKYDILGRTTMARDAQVTKTYEYDDLDRVRSLRHSLAGTSRLNYDADGRIAQFISPDDASAGFPDGIVTTYLYDERGLPEAVVDPVAGIWRFEYDAAGRPVRESAPSGIDREVSYTAEGYLDEVVLTGSSGLIETLAYSGYDDLGNPGTLVGSEGTTTLGYDTFNRVTSVTYPDMTSESFGYDRVGNRTLHVNPLGESRSYQIDAADQLTSIVETSSQTLLESFQYDPAGRRTQHSVAATGAMTFYGYNGNGRLMTLARSDGFAMALSYDATGSLYRRSDTSGVAFYYGGGLEKRYGEKIRLIRGGAEGAVLGEVFDTAPAPTLHAFLRDGSANIAHTTQTDGSTHTRRYQAFGEVRAESGTAAVERGFAGRIVESQSGLMRMGFRHYDPATGRSLQSDPLGLAADQLYAYAANNPYRYHDPLGLSPSLNLGGSSYFGEPSFDWDTSSGYGAYSSPQTSYYGDYSSIPNVTPTGPNRQLGRGSAYQNDPYAHTNPLVVEASMFTGFGAGIYGEVPTFSAELDICYCYEANLEAFRDPPIEFSPRKQAILSFQFLTVQVSFGLTHTYDEGFDFVNPFTDGFISGVEVPSRFFVKPKVVPGIGGSLGFGVDLGVRDP